jgi:hypothetical protein
MMLRMGSEDRVHEGGRRSLVAVELMPQQRQRHVARNVNRILTGRCMRPFSCGTRKARSAARSVCDRGRTLRLRAQDLTVEMRT